MTTKPDVHYYRAEEPVYGRRIACERLPYPEMHVTELRELVTCNQCLTATVDEA